MKSLSTIAVVLAASVASTGCFTTWVGTQAAGKPGAWDEKVREENVPLPGITERLLVSMPLATPSFKLECHSVQNAKDAVYHTAFRYGAGWKKATAIMFLAEAALASVMLLTYDKEKPGTAVVGGLLAVDALGTGVLFFVPRKEVYRRDEKAVTTELRTDCPDGLVVDIGGDQFPVDAAGRIGELGEAAFDAWLEAGQPVAVAPPQAQPQAGPYVPPAYGAPVTQAAPAVATAMAPPAPIAPLLVSFEGKTQEIGLGYSERCLAHHIRHPETPACAATTSTVTTMFEVPVGTFSRIATTN